MLASLVRTSLGIIFTAVLLSPANADDVVATKTDIILTVSSGMDVLTLDRSDLSKLTVTSFDTSTIWTDGIHTFTGLSVKTLIDLIGVTNGMLRATAINNYAIEIPVSDAVTEGPIIAYLMDGKEMSVRDKGPLWVVYPYDSNPDYRSEVVYSRSIWQLDRIEFVQ